MPTFQSDPPQSKDKRLAVMVQRDSGRFKRG
jgi:hypothetical protein